MNFERGPDYGAFPKFLGGGLFPCRNTCTSVNKTVGYGKLSVSAYVGLFESPVPEVVEFARFFSLVCKADLQVLVRVGVWWGVTLHRNQARRA